MNMRWDAIYNRIKDIKQPIGAEIGVYKGELAKNLLKLHSGLVWVMVDAWDPDIYKNKTEESAKQTFKTIVKRDTDYILKCARYVAKTYQNRAILVKAKSMCAVEMFDRQYFDMIFIDSDHCEDAVFDDIFFWQFRVKEGGYIGGHDYGVNEYP